MFWEACFVDHRARFSVLKICTENHPAVIKLVLMIITVHHFCQDWRSRKAGLIL